MIKYKETHPHLVYEEGDIEEIEMIEEAIRRHILKWEKPVGKDFYTTQDGHCIHTIFQPTRRHADAMYLFTKFNHIELEKEDGRYFACVYTGDSDGESELVFFVESSRFELAISLAAYESIKHFG